MPPSAATYAQPQTVPTKGLAITAFVLSLIAFLTGFFWFIAIPLAIVGLILAIVSLAKKRGGKGLSITALVLGGLALIAAPFWLAVSVTSYNSLTEKAKAAQIQSQQQTTGDASSQTPSSN